jgi:hypothetical protein
MAYLFMVFSLPLYIGMKQLKYSIGLCLKKFQAAFMIGVSKFGGFSRGAHAIGAQIAYIRVIAKSGWRGADNGY